MKTARTLSICALALLVAPAAQAQDGSRMLEQMAKADSNHDGNVSKSEFLTYRAQQFDRLDRDGNGVLSDGDLPRIERLRQVVKQHIAGMDADGNGVVSRNEFTNGPTTAFDIADTNKDGLVTKVELSAARQKFEAMAKAQR